MKLPADRAIRRATAIVVTSVAAFAAIVSYSHIFDLGRAHGQDGTAARLLPLSVDGLIAAASLVALYAARNRMSVPWLARVMLGLGISATIGANVAYGWPYGWIGALVSAWPAIAFVGATELLIWLVRASAGRPVSRQAANGNRAANLSNVREWARNNGHDVSDRGRIPKDILESYELVNGN